MSYPTSGARRARRHCHHADHKTPLAVAFLLSSSDIDQRLRQVVVVVVCCRFTTSTRWSRPRGVCGSRRCRSSRRIILCWRCPARRSSETAARAAEERPKNRTHGRDKLLRDKHRRDKEQRPQEAARGGEVGRLRQAPPLARPLHLGGDAVARDALAGEAETMDEPQRHPVGRDVARDGGREDGVGGDGGEADGAESLIARWRMCSAGETVSTTPRGER